MEYKELHTAYSSQVCPKFLGIKIVSSRTLGERIQNLMSRAVALQNSELGQVACDLEVDERKGLRISELDKTLKSINSDLNESEQREQALQHLKQNPLS